MSDKPVAMSLVSGSAGLPPRSAGVLYELVRAHLREHGGKSTRSTILATIQDDSQALAKLKASQGLTALLTNMKHSGFIMLDGDRVILTRRRG